MRRYQCSILKWILLLTGMGIALVPLPLKADVPLPLGQFPFSLDYDLAYHQAITSGNLNLLPPTGPFSMSLFTKNKQTTNYSPTMRLFEVPDNTDNMRLFSLTAQNYRARQNIRLQDLPSLWGGAYYQPSNLFGMVVMFNLDRAKAVDPAYSGKKWRGLAGDLETSAIYFTKDGLSATLGRQRLFWGPQRVNLILSETTEPLDFFSIAYQKGKLQFSFLFARLDQSRPDSMDYIRFPDRSFNDNRYFVGHRLDILFNKHIRLGLFETSLFGGEGRAPELYYLNPLQFFHTAQLNENEDDNTILGLDFTIIPRKGLNCYGQLIIDDFQIDNSTHGDQEPDEVGLMLGVMKTGRVASFSPDIKLEYVRITNRTYHQRDPRNRYLYRNKLIGHPLGPDADSLSMSVRFWLSERQITMFEMAYRRHGEGSIYKPWDQPWSEYQGESYSEPFLTGTVEKTFFIAAHYGGYLPVTEYTANHLYVNLSAGYGWYRNVDNNPGQKLTNSWLHFSIGWLGGFEVGMGD